MRKSLKFPLWVLIFAVSWVAVAYVYSPPYSVVGPILGFFRFLPAPMVTGRLLLVTISAYFLTVLLYALVERKIARGNVIAFYLLYFGFCFYLLFFGRGGNYGINLNPLNAFEIPQNPLIFLLNFVLFTPIGFLLKFRLRNILLVLLGILLVEVLQFVLKVGYADITDVISNLISFVLGTQLIKLAQRLKIKMS